MRGSEWNRRRLDGAVPAALAAYHGSRAAARVSLSDCHISPRYTVEAAPSGAYLAVRASGERQCQPPKNRRGRVLQFSRRSRSRLLKTLAKCDRSATSKSVFVTLTYPRSWPKEYSTYKRHLDTFSKRLLRVFPKASAIWKLEFQVRGAPHFHLIVTGVPFLARGWLARSWTEIVTGRRSNGPKIRTEVRRVKSYRKALSYAAKYVAKVSSIPDSEGVGRFWGVVGRERLPIHCVRWSTNRRGYYQLRRTIRALVSRRRKLSANRRYAPAWAIIRGDRAAVLAQWASGEIRAVR